METPQAPAKGRTDWIMVVSAVVLIGAMGVLGWLAVAHFTDAGTSAAPWPRNATYSVFVSPGNVASVAYGSVNGRGTNTLTTDVNWGTAQDVMPGEVQLIVSSMGAGSVDCSLTVEGFKPITGHGSGVGGTAICSATFK